MTATDHAVSIAGVAAKAASAKIGRDIVAFDVSEKLGIADVFVVVTADNERQVGAIVDGVEEALLKIGEKPMRREGEREASWVLLDYADLVVHVQHAESRALYSLDRLWRDCPVIELDLSDSEPESSISDSDRS